MERLLFLEKAGVKQEQGKGRVNRINVIKNVLPEDADKNKTKTKKTK
jgi:hypothetical protein